MCSVLCGLPCEQLSAQVCTLVIGAMDDDSSNKNDKACAWLIPSAISLDDPLSQFYTNISSNAVDYSYICRDGNFKVGVCKQKMFRCNH